MYDMYIKKFDYCKYNFHITKITNYYAPEKLINIPIKEVLI